MWISARAFQRIFVAKFGFDTADNHPCQVCPLSAYRSPRFHLLASSGACFNDSHEHLRVQIWKIGFQSLFSYAQPLQGHPLFQAKSTPGSTPVFRAEADCSPWHSGSVPALRHERCEMVAAVQLGRLGVPICSTDLTAKRVIQE